MEDKNQKNKSLNFSTATRTSNIEADKEYVKKYDIYLAPASRKSKIGLIVFVIFITTAILAFIKGAIIYGVICIIISVIGLFVFLVFRGIALGVSYEAGLLIPALVINENPLEIVALANIASEEDVDVQYACKKITIQSLPNHSGKRLEKIPCVALFGGSRNGLYSNFEPRPLAWATPNFNSVLNEIDRIEALEWHFLERIIDKVLDLNPDEIALFDHNHNFMEKR